LGWVHTSTSIFSLAADCEALSRTYSPQDFGGGCSDWRFLETVMSVFPRIMLLGVLGVASGSTGFILEHYWSFLTAVFSFAEEALAFGCLPISWTLFCSYKRQQFSFNRYFKLSYFQSKNLYFSWSFYACFHSFIVCRIYSFSHLGG
jgi:hypothetical protein